MKRRPSTRRGKALGWLAVLAVLLAVSAVRYDFTPEDERGRAEEACGTGPTRLVGEVGRLSEDGTQRRLYLSANENAVLLSLARRDAVTGWQAGDGIAVERAGDVPLSGALWAIRSRSGGEANAVWRLYREAEEFERWYLFGWVDDPEIQRIEATFRVPDGGEVLAVRASARAEWLAEEDGAYFILEADPVGQVSMYSPNEIALVGYNSGGAPIEELEIPFFTSYIE